MQAQQADEGRHGVDVAPLAQHRARQPQAGQRHQQRQRQQHAPPRLAPACQLGRQTQALAKQPGALQQLLAAGLVDNKSCSIDERWQALRFVYRLEDR